MKLIKVRRGDTKPRKDLPTDSRTNAQIKQRVFGYVKKVEALTQDITQFLSRQINAMNMELDFSSELQDVNKAMEKFEKKILG